MASPASETLSPVLYLPHGGGPLPILGDKAHEKMVSFLKESTSRLGTPSTILVISAHWEEEIATITSGSYPGIISDYYGFPAEAYRIQYAALGHPQLAKEAFELITASGIPCIRITLDLMAETRIMMVLGVMQRGMIRFI